MVLHIPLPAIATSHRNCTERFPNSVEMVRVSDYAEKFAVEGRAHGMDSDIASVELRDCWAVVGNGYVDVFDREHF